MKILKFTPVLPTQGPEKNRSQNQTIQNGANDFESLLKSASERPAPAASTGAVGQENSRALQLPPLSELGMAGQLLNRLSADIRAASPETLKSVHSLEGLIYVYHKNNG